MHKILATYIFALFSCVAVYGQSHELRVLGTWDNDDLPIRDFQAFNDIWGWHDDAGKEYAIMGSLDSIYFIDVTDPANPVARDVEPGKWNGCVHRDFKTYDKYCYAVADEGYSSLQIFDMSYLPDSVHKVYDSDEFTYKTHNIFIAGTKLYLASCSSDDFIPLRVLSLENPEKPELFFDLYAPAPDGKRIFNEVHDLYARNDTVYCNTGDPGLFTFIHKADTLQKSNDDSSWTVVKQRMRLLEYGSLTWYPSSGYNHSSWLSNNGEYLVMQDEIAGAKLKMVKFSWDELPEVVSTFGVNASKGSTPHNAFIYKKKVYISYYHEGVVIFDIANPETPRLIAQYDTDTVAPNYDGLYGCWGVYPYLPSGNIIASDQLNGLYVFDLAVSTPNIDKVVVEVYPNPTHDFLTIKVPVELSGRSVASILDMSGRQIMQDIELMGDVQIDVSGLASGVYAVRIENGEMSVVKRVVIR